MLKETMAEIRPSVPVEAVNAEKTKPTWKTGGEIGSSINPIIQLMGTAGSPSEFGVQPMDSHKKPDLSVNFGKDPLERMKLDGRTKQQTTLLDQDKVSEQSESDKRSPQSGVLMHKPNKEGSLPPYMRKPYGDKVDPMATEVGDLPPGPSTGEFLGLVPTELVEGVKYQEVIKKQGPEKPILDPVDEIHEEERFGLPPRRYRIIDGREVDVTQNTAVVAKRAERLGKLSFVKGGLGERARNFIRRQFEGLAR